MWTKDLPREHGFEPLEIEGTLPPELRGTLYRNGPGLFGQFGMRYTHPFEGDGAITAIRFEDGGVRRVEDPRTPPGSREERAAGKLLYGLSAPWRRRVAQHACAAATRTPRTRTSWSGRAGCSR